MDKENCLRPGERLDDLGIGGLFIIQDPRRFCFGMDAVLLSSFAKARRGERALDLCAGNGVIPLLLSAKTEAAEITGIELLSENVELANRSVAMNGLSDKIRFIEGDAGEAASLLAAEGGVPPAFDLVTCNPPYMKSGQGLENEKEAVRLARHEIRFSLPLVMGEVAKLLAPKGRAYFAHRPFRLAELFSVMSRAGVEPKTLRLVAPFRGKKPNLALVEGVKGAKPFLEVEPELIVYESPGAYTPEVLEIYGLS